MNRNWKTMVVLAVGAVLAALVPAAPASARAWSCGAGFVCFYTGANGGGSRCAWSVADPSWTGGTSVCSWATTTNVKSVWNNGSSSSYTGVAYYLSRDYGNRVGCTPQGARGNLVGDYKVLSHQWVTGSCG